MRLYPKIETLFERDPATFRVDPTHLRIPAAAEIAKWSVTEKVDGMNIRIVYVKGEPSIKIGGRSDNAQLPADLIQHIYDTFPREKFEACFKPDTADGTGLVLYGEGYGAGIQKGGYYRSDKAVILFDAAFCYGEGFWWQPEDTVTELAEKFGVPRVPILGRWSLDEIVDFVRPGAYSVIAQQQAISEGVVGRTRVPLFDANGRRLIIKLKTVDFTGKGGK